MTSSTEVRIVTTVSIIPTMRTQWRLMLKVETRRWES